MDWLDTIICGDSREVLKQIPDNMIDIVITSPPYNVGMKYNDYNDCQSSEDYFEMLQCVWSECFRILKLSGRICINTGGFMSGNPMHHIVSQQLRDLGMLWKGEIIWDKHNYKCNTTAWGSWKSPSAPHLKYTWEFIEIFCKESQKKEGNKELIDITGEEFMKWIDAHWRIQPEINMLKYNHPAMFPEELVVRLLKLFSYQCDVVLDPFNGVGTTTAVAFRLNRHFVGVDISEQYCETARARLERERRKKEMSLF